MMMNPLLTDDNLLNLLVAEKDVSDGYKLQIPQRCTTSHRGPLKLTSNNRQTTLPPDRHTTCSSLPPLPIFVGRNRPGTRTDLYRAHSLNRYPVVFVQRPMDEVKMQLDKGLSLTEFQENVKNLQISSNDVKSVHLPLLLTRHIQPTSSAPLLHSAPTTHTYYSRCGPMDITITFKHSANDRDQTSFDCVDKQLPEETQYLSKERHSERRGGRLPYVPLAPPSLNAVLAHREQPITANTRIKGTRLY